MKKMMCMMAGLMMMSGAASAAEEFASYPGNGANFFGENCSVSPRVDETQDGCGSVTNDLVIDFNLANTENDVYEVVIEIEKRDRAPEEIYRQVFAGERGGKIEMEGIREPVAYGTYEVKMGVWADSDNLTPTCSDKQVVVVD